MITGHCTEGLHGGCPSRFCSCSFACHPRHEDLPDLFARGWTRAEAARASILPRWENDEAFSQGVAL